jgi:hypothetical protein
MAGSSRSKWYRRVDYPGYAIGCAFAWAVIWLLVGTLASTNTVHVLAYVFLGWVIGWGSASIARIFYPPPKFTVLKRHGSREL